MHMTIRIMRILPALLAPAGLLLSLTVSTAQEPDKEAPRVDAELQKKINAAVDKGIAYLKQANAARRAALGEDAAAIEEPSDDDEGTEEATLTPARYATLSAREQFVLAVSESGFGKRSSSYEYRVTGRGGSGIVAIGMGRKNAAVIAAFPVEEADPEEDDDEQPAAANAASAASVTAA